MSVARIAGVVVLAAGLTAACGDGPANTPAEHTSDVHSQLDSMWSELSAAMVAGDTDAVGLFYTDSAYFAEADSPTLRGREAIVASIASVFACCSYLESQRDIERTNVVGDLAVQFGTFLELIQANWNARIEFYGRFEAVLERDSTGMWRISSVVVLRDSLLELGRYK